jgi:hypothetical protein
MMQVPPEGTTFAVPVRMAAAEPAAKERRFSGVAYGGGVITDHAWWNAVAFDLAGLTARLPMPLLLQHDQERMIGVVDEFINDGAQMAIGGKLFTGIDPHADAVAAKADAGAPWQMSVGIFPDRIEELQPAQTALVNGRQIVGSAHIFRASRVRETSFVALGADGSTRAQVFNQGGQCVAELVTKEPPMADTDHAAQLAAITAERDAEKSRADKAAADLASLQEQFSARERTERETAVKALLGEAFSADKAAPYLSMTPEQFAAVQTAVSAVRSKLPPGFTTEQATGGTLAGAAKVTPEAIHKYRRDNPGASHEQAFAALKSAA